MSRDLVRSMVEQVRLLQRGPTELLRRTISQPGARAEPYPLVLQVALGLEVELRLAAMMSLLAMGKLHEGDRAQPRQQWSPMPKMGLFAVRSASSGLVKVHLTTMVLRSSRLTLSRKRHLPLQC